MNSVRRYEAIMEQLLSKREVTVAELSEQLQVTGKTIREDLAKLEEKGLLHRVHGGALLAHSDQLGLLTPKGPVTPHAAEKSAIAAMAVSMIEPYEVIALDVGSTTLEIARQLENRPQTVVTNDIHIISELASKEQIRLVVPGGYRVRNMLAGPESVEFVRKLNIHKAFLSATGIHTDYGFTIYTGELMEMKRALLEASRTSYVAAAHHKFGQSALLTYAQFPEIEAVLTDSGIASETEAAYRSSGLNIQVAPK
ncbi:DeoR/GlpR family DNA-binding transcription regulator [Paenibacillus gansuensis]|uniref:DeoR/GlpR family DNA-binding transcription regulator n=1 Tax=Paenibacillus gansuensis TaxID=306542 RepID=A0ABW5P9H0_9BACL